MNISKEDKIPNSVEIINSDGAKTLGIYWQTQSIYI